MSWGLYHLWCEKAGNTSVLPCDISELFSARLKVFKVLNPEHFEVNLCVKKTVNGPEDTARSN